MDKVHMVEQVIKYSDGSETVIKYRGVIEDGVLYPDKVEETPAVEETVEVPTPEESVETPETVEETVAESTEETA